MKKKIFYIPVAFFLLTIMNAEANSEGRIQVFGAGASNSLGIVGGDAMTPLLWKQDNLLFVDLMGDYASNATYLTSPGVGFRTIHKNQILGASFFGDYERTSLGANFWNLSPGVEWMNPKWDAHVNGYFPMTTSRQIGSTDYANTFGDNSQVTFVTGTHNQYDALVTPFAVIGNGVDAAVGYSFDDHFDHGTHHLRSRVYLGTYYYQAPSDMNVDNITGVTGGFSQAISKNLTVSVFNSYDQVNQYVVGASLTLTFGGNSNILSTDVHDRLFDTVQRHIGIIDTGAGNYDQEGLQNDGMALEYDNIYFVSPNGSGDGTLGNPMSLSQSSLDQANDNNPNDSRIYIQGGNNVVYAVDSSTATESDRDANDDLGLYVYNGQSFYGRNADYTTAASSNEQPQIEADGLNNYSAFIIQNGDNTFSDLSISSSTSGYGTGILAYNNGDTAESLTIDNTTISQFITGLSVNNSGAGSMTVNTDGSSFNENSVSGNAVTAYGMNVSNTGTGSITVNADNSSFNDNSATGDGVQVAGLGVNNQNSGSITVNMNNSTFNNNTTSGSGDSMAVGVYAFNQGSGTITLNANSSQFNGNTSSSYEAFGLEAINVNSGTLIVNATNSQFSSNTGAYLSAGLAAENFNAGTLNINSLNSTYANNTGEYGYGLYAKNFSTGTLSVSELNSTFGGNTTADSIVID